MTTQSAINTFDPLSRIVVLLASIMVLIGGPFVYFSGALSDSSVASQKLVDLQAQLTEYQGQTSAQLTAIQGQLASLPSQAVTIEQTKDHLHAIDGRLDGFDTRLRAVEQEYSGVRADLDNIMRSDSVPLGGGRR
ncbi:MAG: hypothetical protein KGL35_12015 [Bradyrhizobium sp.]|nr:hypothetical protein [Bradyrhizobium sp.]